MRSRHHYRADHEHDQTGDIDFPPTDQIAQAAHEHHADCIGQQITGDDPGSVIQGGLQRQTQIEDDFRQERADDGQIERKLTMVKSSEPINTGRQIIARMSQGRATDAGVDFMMSFAGCGAYRITVYHTA